MGLPGGLVLGSFGELAVDEGRSGADERDQVGGVDHAPAALRGLDQLEGAGVGPRNGPRATLDYMKRQVGRVGLEPTTGGL
jgi:hypothetical protein